MHYKQGTSAVFWLFALVHSFAFATESEWLNVGIKATPAILLAALVWHLRTARTVLTVSVFLMCALGDILLAVTFKHQFIAGLGAFLVVHALLVFRLSPLVKMSKAKMAALLIFALFVSASAIVILQHSAQMFWPILAYICIITAMALTAVLASHLSWKIGVGALLFTISDLIIGIDRFVTGVPYEHQVIMLTYYSAIFLLALGIIESSAIEHKS